MIILDDFQIIISFQSLKLSCERFKIQRSPEQTQRFSVFKFEYSNFAISTRSPNSLSMCLRLQISNRNLQKEEDKEAGLRSLKLTKFLKAGRLRVALLMIFNYLNYLFFFFQLLLLQMNGVNRAVLYRVCRTY